MDFRKIRVDTFLQFNNGTTVRKEFEFELFGVITHNSLIKYINENTPNCINVNIIDVYLEN